MAIRVVTTGSDPVVNGANFQTELNAAVAGDTVQLTAGATYDGTFTLANKSATASTPILITTNNQFLLSNRRVTPSDVSNMARVRTLGGSNTGPFKSSPGADWWVLDGLELTDNGPTNILISALVDFDFGGSHLTVKRCYLHNKETGTNYNRSIRFGVHFEGSGLTMKWNYIYIIGYGYPAGNFTPLDTMAVLSVGGNTILLEDNHISSWYNPIFMGGGDSPPQNSATLTSATTSSATFSNTTGLAAGVMLRFDMPGVGTIAVTGADTINMTLVSGVVITSAETSRVFRAIARVTGENGVFEVTGVTGSVVSANWRAQSHLPNGSTVDFTFYETAIISSVAGSVVNYTPYGLHALTISGAGVASWNYGDQGQNFDVTVRKNTIYLDPLFAADVKLNNGNTPKGFYEIKRCKRMTVEGNRFEGWPGVVVYTATNQNGTDPWGAVQDVFWRSNWFAPDNRPGENSGAVLITTNEYLGTVFPLTNIQITNNVFLNCQNIIGGGGNDNWLVEHNTAINLASGTSYNSLGAGVAATTNFKFRNNIGFHRAYGFICFFGGSTMADCWPSGTFLNNVVGDNNAIGFGTNVFGAGSALAPIPTSVSGIGFVDAAANNYKLAPSSPYKNLATDGTDPGVDFDVLLAALAGESGPPPTQFVVLCIS